MLTLRRTQPAVSGRRAFTLIELLVVIAIIAILAAILFPVFAKAREKARQISCLNNVKQLSLAFIQYQSDSDGLFPNTTEGPNGNYDPTVAADAMLGGPVGWMSYKNYANNPNQTVFNPILGSVFGYIKSTAVYVCPDDPLGAKNGPNNGSGNSYSINACTVSTNSVTVDATHAYRSGKSEVVFDSPSNVMLLGEEAANATDPHNGTSNDSYLYPNKATPASHDMLSTRHSDGSNIAYVDGHAKWIADPNSKFFVLITGDTTSTPANFGSGGTTCPGG